MGFCYSGPSQLMQRACVYVDVGHFHMYTQAIVDSSYLWTVVIFGMQSKQILSG